MATPEKRAAMQKKFKQLDKDGNGVLDFNELHDLLLKGHPGFKEEDAWDLFRKCDKDGSGSVSFDEFLDYIYGEGQAAHKAGRSTEGRHAALAAKSGPQQDGTEEDWGKCFGVFEAYAGKDMDGKEFAKFCKDNHLIGHGMKKTDVDLILQRSCPKASDEWTSRCLRNPAGMSLAKEGARTVTFRSLSKDPAAQCSLVPRQSTRSFTTTKAHTLERQLPTRSLVPITVMPLDDMNSSKPQLQQKAKQPMMKMHPCGLRFSRSSTSS